MALSGSSESGSRSRIERATQHAHPFAAYADLSLTFLRAEKDLAADQLIVHATIDVIPDL